MVLVILKDMAMITLIILKMPDDIRVSLNNAGVFDKIKLLVEKS